MEFCAFSCDANHVFWSPRHIPNIISAFRILLVAPIAVALADRQLVTTIILFGVAALSDAADGFLAKRYGWQSDLGAVLDPAADKLLLVTVFITLAYLKLVPLWLMAAAVTRDLMIVLGALVFVTVAVSGIDYLLIYGRRALGLAKPRAVARAGDRRP